MLRRTRMNAALVLSGSLMLTACAGAPVEQSTAGSSDGVRAVTLPNCDLEVSVQTPPERVITLNQGATEVVLALGLGDQLVGTAYLDDAVADQWSDEYDLVDVLADEYPTYEAILSAEPDFLYASYASAFDREVAGDRKELRELGTASYLSPFGCPETSQRPEPAFEAVWQEIREVATLLGSPESASTLVAEQEKALKSIARDNAGRGLTALWFDSGDKTPYVGGGRGGPQLILDAVGADNMFQHLAKGWAEGNWEDVVEEDPDFIVLADASWSTADDKRSYLQQDPVLSKLRAVRDEAFVTVAYSETTPGVRMVDGAKSVADQLNSLGLAE